MADWTAPFHMPTYTDDDFEIQKAKYVAEHGYTITVPGLSDIIHFSTPDPMTEQEKSAWKDKDWQSFPSSRLEELRKLKAKKRARYLAMLADPTPSVVSNAGSIMTSLDDAQDAISTLAMIGRIAAKFAPRVIGKAFLGPVGWLLMANDIMNLIIALGMSVTMPLMAKRGKEQATGSSPFSKQAKIRRAKKLITAMPSKADIIQALQTTDQVFGFGISLGPIVGLAQATMAGAVRSAMGQEVKLKLPWKGVTNFANTAFSCIRTAGYIFSHPFGTDDTMFSEVFMASYLSHQCIMPIQQEWNPLDQVEDVEGVEGLAPIPNNVLTLEIIEEEGQTVEEVTGWPHVNGSWANLSEYADFCRPLATDNLKRFVERNNHNWHGYTGGLLACEMSTYCLANLEGEDEVKYDYDAKSKIAGNMLAAGVYPDPDQDPRSLARFATYLDNASKGYVPTATIDVLRYCKNRGIKLLSIA